MYKIIGDENRVNYGCIDQPVDFNYQDFKLKDFFGKEITGLKKKFAFHKFNYIGIIADDFLIGIATVSLGYAYNVFAYLYDYKEGKVYEFDKKGIRDGKGLVFPANPDEYEIEMKTRTSHLIFQKSHAQGYFKLDCNFEGKLKIKGNFPYSLESHQPLRVLNPSDPSRWTFTEKCSPLLPESLTLEYLGKPLPFKQDRVTMLYDWSGGYLRRETNWFWAAFSGIEGENQIGANIAALVNESYYPENAFWVNGQRSRLQGCVFEFSEEDPYKPWRIRDEAGKVDLIFTPDGERSEKTNLILVKTSFRQFVGSYQGTFVLECGKEVKFTNLHGFAELHRALW